MTEVGSSILGPSVIGVGVSVGIKIVTVSDPYGVDVNVVDGVERVSIDAVRDGLSVGVVSTVVCTAWLTVVGAAVSCGSKINDPVVISPGVPGS